MWFEDREDAGRRLAAALEPFRDEDPVVLALPRGGVPVGYEVARALGAPLDVFIVRKLGAPFQPELGVGAIAEDGTLYVDDAACASLDISDEEIARVAAREREELARRVRRFRGDRTPAAVTGRTVLLVDDGIATGGTARAAITAVRRMRPRRLILAVPVASAATLASLRGLVDEVVCLHAPVRLMAIGEWYRDFAQVSDEEVIDLLARAAGEPDAGGEDSAKEAAPQSLLVQVATGGVTLEGDLVLPSHAHGIVLFAHGSGSSRKSPRNRLVARALQDAGLATLLLDLLTAEEERVDDVTAELRFDIELLARRLVGAIDWIQQKPRLRRLRLGCFGASTGAAAALIAAAERPDDVCAVVSRGGRPDLAGDVLPRVHVPTLLIVGGADHAVLDLNRRALAEITGEKQLLVVPDATHLFEEPGALEQVAEMARRWFVHFLITQPEHGDLIDMTTA